MDRFKIAFMFFLLAVTIVTTSWIKHNYRIHGPDATKHQFAQLKFSHDLSRIIDSSLNIPARIKKTVWLLSEPVQDIGFTGNLYWPNGTYFVTSLFQILYGRTLFVSRISMLFFFLIAAVATFSIADRLGGKRAAFYSAVFLFFYPLIYESLTQYTLDLPLTAMVCLSILCLMKSNFFQRRSFSFLAGVISGIGMLCKGQEAIFLFFPVLWVLAGAFFPRKEEKNLADAKNMIVNIVLFLIPVILISSIWWGDRKSIEFIIVNLKGELSSLKFEEASILSGAKGRYSLPQISFYLTNCFRDSMSPVPFIIFLCAVFSLLKNGFYRSFKEWMIVALWIIPPIIVFSLFFSYQSPRLLMPILPAFAIVTAVGIGQVQKKVIRYGAIGALCCSGLFNFVSFQQELSFRLGSITIPLPRTAYTFGREKEEWWDALKGRLQALRLREDSYVGVIAVNGRDVFDYMYKLKLIEPSLLYVDLLGISKGNSLVDYFRGFPLIIVVSGAPDIPFGEALIQVLKTRYHKQFQLNFVVQGGGARFFELKEIAWGIPRYFYQYEQIRLRDCWVTFFRNKRL
ncbi:MAG: glycosyltransferase family 39 protein [Candidatus Omnitrophica bacterium]|nr:glycosyltransferase family 39 protein [Candidatus Omnitrophota bacterium]